MRTLLAIAVVGASACASVGDFTIGTTVPIDQLYQQRDNLRAWIAAEVNEGHAERAFYATEILKTRRFAAQRLLSRRADVADETVAHRDLRPVFAEVFGQPGEGESPPLVASRGLNRVSAGAQKRFDDYGAAADEAFWNDQRLFRERLAAQMPYRHALRNSFAATTSDEARGMLAQGDVLLSFFVDGDRVHVFVLRPGSLELVTLQASTSELRALATAFLDTVSAPPESPTDQAWLAHAAALYDALLAPLGTAVTRDATRSLYVIPDGFLGAVPFGLLAEAKQATRTPLLERIAVSYFPSVTIYRRLMMREILARPPAILTVGDPAYSVAVPKLPSAAREARVLSRIFPVGTYLTGERATESAVREAVVGHNILHFATHGVLLGRRLAGASSLLVAAGGDHDGLLSAAEIATLDLAHVNLAVLSACQTGVGAEDAATLDVGSLAGAFMAAGAPSVVGSLWQVSDDSTTLLFVSFYEAFLERGSGEALRSAQLAVKERSDFAHPYYWAAFVLYGWDK